MLLQRGRRLHRESKSVTSGEQKWNHSTMKQRQEVTNTISRNEHEAIYLGLTSEL